MEPTSAPIPPPATSPDECAAANAAAFPIACDAATEVLLLIDDFATANSCGLSPVGFEERYCILAVSWPKICCWFAKVTCASAAVALFVAASVASIALSAFSTVPLSRSEEHTSELQSL